MSRIEQTLNKPIVVLVVGVIAVALNVLLYFGYFLPRTTPLVEQIYSIGTSLPEAISKSDSETGSKADPEASGKSGSADSGKSGSQSSEESVPEESLNSVVSDSSPASSSATSSATSSASSSATAQDSPSGSAAASSPPQQQASSSPEASSSHKSSQPPEASPLLEASPPPPVLRSWKDRVGGAGFHMVNEVLIKCCPAGKRRRGPVEAPRQRGSRSAAAGPPTALPPYSRHLRESRSRARRAAEVP